MNKIFTNEIWTKNWSGQWGLPFVSLYGDFYARSIKELAGQGLAHNLIVFESGTSSNYLVRSELSAYCQLLVSIIIKDSVKPGQWASQLTMGADKIYEFIRELDSRNTFSPADFFKFQDLLLAMTSANFSIKQVINFLPQELMEKYLDTFRRARLHCEPIYNETERIFQKILDFLIGKRFSTQEISVLLKEEIREYFLNGNLPDAEELTERYRGCAILYDADGKFNLYKGEEFKKIMEGIVAGLPGSEIKGMVAYKGMARGRVRVVFDPKADTDFKPGDVLVAGMTRPEYLSLMKMSAAFVTDAGGLLSHAAIVARELKKPCIIGTEIATKVFKDGDLVEVDANKGIVKRIEQ
ncbi:hypothetical protein EPN28_03650 [Patescibacteria group bacterium]|nr:MAG: hypothetical protein EPN28_03650 [Patescibacteria group bacterium]